MDGFKTRYRSVEKLLLCASFLDYFFYLLHGLHFSLISARKNGGEPHIATKAESFRAESTRIPALSVSAWQLFQL